MKHIAMIITFLTITALCASTAPAAEGQWEYPVIKGAGEIVSLPQAKVQPDQNIKYKIVFDITKGKAETGKLVPGLTKVARVINVFASAGMGPEKMDLVLVFHGPSTEAVLQGPAYQAKHGFANPNLELISQLKKAGVQLYVCGQALKEHSIAHADVSPQIDIALSALTVLPTYQLRGYALMSF